MRPAQQLDSQPLYWQKNEGAGEYSYVYYYLLAGIMLMVAVFLFLPRIAVG